MCIVPGCGKAFQTTSNLKRHIKTHRELGPDIPALIDAATGRLGAHQLHNLHNLHV